MTSEEKRKLVLATAAKEKGTKESPAKSNKTKYGAWYGLDGVAWCAIFVSWVFNKSGLPLGKIDSGKGYHYCPSAYNYWRKNGELTTNPQPGDIVLYDWNRDKLSDHTGIFICWINETKGTFKAWEGNTSVDSNSDGGEVQLREDRNRTQVLAFVSPKIYKS